MEISAVDAHAVLVATDGSLKGRVVIDGAVDAVDDRLPEGVSLEPTNTQYRLLPDDLTTARLVGDE